MLVSRIAFACIAPLALSVAAAPALAQGGPTAFERGVLAQLSPAVRADVEKRATGGNTVLNVVGTMLLNNYYGSGATTPGQAFTVVAVDFGRGAAVLKRDPNTFDVVQFDPATLRIKR